MWMLLLHLHVNLNADDDDVGKTRVLISCTVYMQLICAFVFAYRIRPFKRPHPYKANHFFSGQNIIIGAPSASQQNAHLLFSFNKCDRIPIKI